MEKKELIYPLETETKNIVSLKTPDGGLPSNRAGGQQFKYPLHPVDQEILKRFIKENGIVSGSLEIFIPAEAMNPTTSSGCSSLTKVEAGTNDVDYWVLDFDTTTGESCFFTIKMPDNWNGGAVSFVFVWTNASGLTTETVAFGIKGRAYADSDAIDQAYGTEVVVTDTWLAQNDIHITDESALVTPSGNLQGGQWCQFKITRKVASDDLTGDARLIGVRLKYYIT